MKYLRMFEAASGLFPKKIKVSLIDANTGNNLGKYTIQAELLPPAFNRPVILEIGNVQWRILQADPISADDFLFTKRLTLKVQDAAKIDERLPAFTLPSVCSELPITGEDSLLGEFTLEISKVNWRQIEFFQLGKAAIIEDAVNMVDNILNNSPNPLMGYGRQHVRDHALQPALAIPWEEFCSSLTDPIKGNVVLDSSGFVQHGFALRTDSYTYYGIIKDGFIDTLCLSQFEWADDELMNVLSTYDLLLVDWCNASRISAEAGEEPKSEFIKI